MFNFVVFSSSVLAVASGIALTPDQMTASVNHRVANGKVIDQTTTYLSGFVLQNFYTDTTCSEPSQPVATEATAFNQCIPTSSSDTTTYSITTSDLSCQTIKTVYYTDSACTTVDTNTPSISISGYTCTVSGNQGYYTTCSFETPLPSLPYDNVMMTQFVTNVASGGCSSQPQKIAAYALDYCASTQAASYKYTCDGTQAKYTSYEQASCTNNEQSVLLPSLCIATAYTSDDSTDDPTYASENVQYVCNQGSSSDDDSLSGGAVAGIVIAILIFLMACVGVYFVVQKIMQPKAHDSVEEDGETTSPMTTI